MLDVVISKSVHSHVHLRQRLQTYYISLSDNSKALARNIPLVKWPTNDEPTVRLHKYRQPRQESVTLGIISSGLISKHPGPMSTFQGQYS